MLMQVKLKIAKLNASEEVRLSKERRENKWTKN